MAAAEDARAAARRIVEQVLADHARGAGRGDGAVATLAPTERPVEHEDSPAWQTARRIVDEVLAAHAERMWSHPADPAPAATPVDTAPVAPPIDEGPAGSDLPELVFDLSTPPEIEAVDAEATDVEAVDAEAIDVEAPDLLAGRLFEPAPVELLFDGSPEPSAEPPAPAPGTDDPLATVPMPVPDPQPGPDPAPQPIPDPGPFPTPDPLPDPEPFPPEPVPPDPIPPDPVPPDPVPPDPEPQPLSSALPEVTPSRREAEQTARRIVQEVVAAHEAAQHEREKAERERQIEERAVQARLVERALLIEEAGLPDEAVAAARALEEVQLGGQARLQAHRWLAHQEDVPGPDLDSLPHPTMPAPPVGGPPPIPPAARATAPLPQATSDGAPAPDLDATTVVVSRASEDRTAALPSAYDEPEPPRTGRWLLTTIVGALALALLFPLAVAALRSLVTLG